MGEQDHGPSRIAVRRGQEPRSADNGVKLEALPCPFCGYGVVTVLRPTCTRASAYDPADRAFPVVRCMGCYAEAVGDDWDASAETARRAWNRRTPDAEARVLGAEAALADVLDALKGACLDPDDLEDRDAAPLIRKLIADLLEANCDHEAVQQRALRLEEALDPFTDISGEGDEDFPDDTRVTITFGRTTDWALTLGDFRRARIAALSPTPTLSGGEGEGEHG